jgi:hypothetical protein
MLVSIPRRLTHGKCGTTGTSLGYQIFKKYANLADNGKEYLNLF